MKTFYNKRNELSRSLAPSKNEEGQGGTYMKPPPFQLTNGSKDDQAKLRLPRFEGYRLLDQELELGPIPEINPPQLLPPRIPDLLPQELPDDDSLVDRVFPNEPEAEQEEDDPSRCRVNDQGRLECDIEQRPPQYDRDEEMPELDPQPEPDAEEQREE